MSYFTTAGVSLITLIAAGLGVVVLNVLYQLFWPRDPTKPPVVFHYVPILGCAVSYGMDPYKFLFDARDKVSQLLSFISILTRSLLISFVFENNTIPVWTCLHLSSSRQEYYRSSRSIREWFRIEWKTSSCECRGSLHSFDYSVNVLLHHVSNFGS